MARLRICDNGREQITPASADLVERTFAPEAPVSDGLEVSLAEGDWWLAAIAVGAAGTPAEFLVSGDDLASPVILSRTQALERFRGFLARTSVPER
jgi:hypothetical protein